MVTSSRSALFLRRELLSKIASKINTNLNVICIIFVITIRLLNLFRTQIKLSKYNKWGYRNTLLIIFCIHRFFGDLGHRK